MKKYGTLEEVVIEMPRDQNSEEQKKWEKERQKKNEKELAYIEKKLFQSEAIGVKVKIVE